MPPLRETSKLKTLGYLSHKYLSPGSGALREHTSRYPLHARVKLSEIASTSFAFLTSLTTTGWRAHAMTRVLRWSLLLICILPISAQA